jgi:spermidine/putrescine transport system permease protein
MTMATSVGQPPAVESEATIDEPVRLTRGAKFQLGIPVTLWVFVLGIPFLLMTVISFWPNYEFAGMTPGFTLDNWSAVFTTPLYRDALIRSLLLAGCATVVSVGIGFPTAYFIATRVRRRSSLFYVLLQVPLWTAYLIRAYAWRVVLGEDGLIARGLRALGFAGTPEWLLFSDFAVVLVIATMFIPFVTISVFPALEAIPPDLREASKDLHGGRFATFAKVTWPLAMPAVIAAATYTLAISFGDFISPTLVGAPDSIMMTQLIFNQVGVAYDWPMAAALSLAMFVVILPLVIYAQRSEHTQTVALRR